MTNLPFDPESVRIEDLAAYLEEEDFDEDAVHELQRADTRKGAAAVYERRVDAIRDSQDSDSPEDPDPESEPEPEAAPADPDEDIKRGYRITSWAGHPNYECVDCPSASLKEDVMIRHRTDQH